MTTNQSEKIHTKVILKTKDFLKGYHPKHADKHATELIDAESWIASHWLNTFAKNSDELINSSYFSLVPVKGGNWKIQAGPVWDFDRNLGSLEPIVANPVDWSGMGGTSQVWHDQRAPWWGLILKDPDFWFKHRSGALSWKSIEAIIHDHHSSAKTWPRPDLLERATKARLLGPFTKRESMKVAQSTSL